MANMRLGWIVVLIVVGVLVSPSLGPAQPPQKDPKTGQFPPPKPPITQPVVQQPQPTERRPPAPEYAIAILSTLIVLVIVCMPSRKGV